MSCKLSSKHFLLLLALFFYLVPVSAFSLTSLERRVVESIKEDLKNVRAELKTSKSLSLSLDTTLIALRISSGKKISFMEESMKVIKEFNSIQKRALTISIQQNQSLSSYLKISPWISMPASSLIFGAGFGLVCGFIAGENIGAYVLAGSLSGITWGFVSAFIMEKVRTLVFP